VQSTTVTTPNGFEIHVRSHRAQKISSLATACAAWFGAFYFALRSNNAPEAELVLVIVIGGTSLGLTYGAALRLFNTARIVAHGSLLHVSHGPLPEIRAFEVSGTDLNEIVSRRIPSGFALLAVMRHGKKRYLCSIHDPAEAARVSRMLGKHFRLHS
jgi:hypothetical protein